MIPVGTLCYFVGPCPSFRRYIGHTCTVVDDPCSCGDPFGEHPARVLLHDGHVGCIAGWSQLRPISPPPQSVDTKHDERVPA